MQQKICFSEEEMVIHLELLRSIVALDDKKALEELKNFFQNLLSLFNSEIEWILADLDDEDTQQNQELDIAREILASMKKAIMRVEKLIESGQEPDFTLEEKIRNAARVDSYWDEETSKELQSQIDDIKNAAEKLLIKIKIQHEIKYIEKSLNVDFGNVVSVNNRIKGLTEAEAILVEHNAINDALRRDVRKGKERAARYRAEKKLSDAEVALECGKNKRANTLKSEAQGLLRQDWKKAFPDEESPLLS